MVHVGDNIGLTFELIHQGDLPINFLYGLLIIFPFGIQGHGNGRMKMIVRNSNDLQGRSDRAKSITTLDLVYLSKSAFSEQTYTFPSRPGIDLIHKHSPRRAKYKKSITYL